MRLNTPRILGVKIILASMICSLSANADPVLEAQNLLNNQCMCPIQITMLPSSQNVTAQLKSSARYVLIKTVSLVARACKKQELRQKVCTELQTISILDKQIPSVMLNSKLKELDVSANLHGIFNQKISHTLGLPVLAPAAQQQE